MKEFYMHLVPYQKSRDKCKPVNWHKKEEKKRRRRKPTPCFLTEA
jgi:hypothetical protein